jgi:hypothetical protein
MKWFAFPRLLPVLVLVIAACSTPQTTVERKQRDSLLYEVMVRAVGPAEVSKDGFDARFEFEVVSEFDLQRNSLVQELKQTITFEYDDGSTRERELSLVEAFKLRPPSYRDGDRRYHYRIYAGQSDRHSMKGMNDLPDDVVAVRLEREVFAYVADVENADFTPAGFAHLPQNEDGSVVSDIPDRFNENYQRNHTMQGWVRNSGDSLGLVYRITFRLIRTVDESPQFVVDRSRGLGKVEMPSVLWRTR